MNIIILLLFSKINYYLSQVN